MSNFSDHKKPQFDVNKYLPEVYRSDVNTSVFDMAFNRHLTKDDTQRVAGVIGTSSPNALVKRQIQEPTPHRQAYQLAPTMYSRVGAVENALSFKAFLEQLSLIGVDVDRIQKWADTLQFNWVPPINIDMLVNYQDYFWDPVVPGETPQYFTVENRCNKSKIKLTSYQNVLQQRGSAFPVTRIDFANNAFVVSSKMDDLFVDGFVFFTTDATNVNVADKFWTVQSSTFNDVTYETTIQVIEPIAIHSATQPTTSIVGQWWYNTADSTLHQWTGTAWALAARAVAVTISLAELQAVYQTETNCACAQDIGWDMNLWDDNQTGAVLWNADLFSTPTNPNPPKRIDFATEADWISWNTAHPQTPPVLSGTTPANYALWYDTTADQLKQYASVDGSNPSDPLWSPHWIAVVSNFSALKDKTVGTARWDNTVGCNSQSLTQWSSQNRWLHKTEVQSFSRVKRAQMPIIEFSSTIETNDWVSIARSWMYRSQADKTFAASSGTPTRLELEPIKGFVVTNVAGIWTLYLVDKTKSGARDVNYTDTFVPGFKFRIVDDGAMSDVYTVASAQYREITSDLPASVLGAAVVGTMCTVITLSESVYSSPIFGGGTNHVRIEPLTTSVGDTWRGYHLHWLLDTTSVITTPTGGRVWNIYRQQDVSTNPVVDLVAGNPTYTSINFKPAQTTQVEIGASYQSMTLSIPDVLEIDLVPKFRYDGSSSVFYALPNSNELRVYVNGVRQYGNYVERTQTVTPDYTLVGQTPYTNTTLSYVVGITFDRPLKALDTVRIEVGPAAFDDMGNFCVPVRTIADETAFAAAVVAGTQPSYISLSKNNLMEQLKTKANDYPLFNVYDLVEGAVVQAAPLFSYREDPSAAINTTLQRRIVVSSDGKDYDFKQDLVDRDDNILFGYRDSSLSVTYWYNPMTKTLKYWDNTGWALKVPSTVSGALKYFQPVVSDVEPVALLNIDQSIWFDTRTNSVKQRNVGLNSWSIIPSVVSISDPTLRTVWRKGLNNERSVPQYVDKDRNPIAVGSPDGDWGVVDQWMYNIEHHNKKIVQYSQIFTHFTSIIKNQPRVPGVQGGGVFTLTQDAYNYGVGGTIKEHNDSFDTLISAINVANVTPTTILSYAGQEYVSALLRVRELFIKHAVSLISSYSPAAIINMSAYITSTLIAQYQDNDAYSQIFGDSSSYDPVTKVGVKNWIATAPMFGICEKHQPYLNKTGSFTELVHHDGHRSTISFTAVELDRIARMACTELDPRTSTMTGVISLTTPPTTKEAITAAFGSVRGGVLWYRYGGGVRTLYKLDLLDVSNTHPATTVSGIAVTDGTLYFNTRDNLLYSCSSGTWVAASAVNDLALAWKQVDLVQLLAELELEIERRLYDITPDQSLAFDYTSLQQTIDDVAEYNRLYAERFLSFVQASEITAPFVNVDYQATNAFTWNYSSSTISSPPRLDISPTIAASWQELYLRWYGTPYPHLEPWKLQGYSDKPDWWDEMYLDVTGARRWVYTHSANIGSAVGMWENIRTGVVPAGKILPNGITSAGARGQVPTYLYFSVNISNQSVNGYPPDALLPPYFQMGNDPLIRSLFALYATEISSPDADYVFGDVGPVEWQWKTSVEYVYDIAIIAFLMQPARFLHSTFGPVFTSVDGLQVDTLFKQVYSHEDALFHGDIYNGSTSYLVRGLNQWYVNYNRDTAYDTNGEFRTLWTTWTPKLTYQFGGIIDTSSFEIANKYMNLVEADYNIVLVNNGVIKDLWSDSFNVKLISSPPPLVQFNNQSQWKMEFDTVAAIPRPVHYYGVKEYVNQSDPLISSPVTIVSVTANNEFVISGNVARLFPPESELQVTGSTGNDGTYTVVSAHNSGNQTIIRVVERIPSGATA